MTERGGAQAGDPDLDELRAELARFVLREAGHAVVADPSLPLSAALTRAIHEEAERAARLARETQPTSEELAASVMQAVRPELVQIVRAAARGDVDQLDRKGLKGRISSMPGPLIAIAALAGLLLAFAVGFGAAWMLAPGSRAADPPPMDQSTPPVTVDDLAGALVEDPAVPADSAATGPADLPVQDPAP